MEQIAEQTGKTPPELIGPEFPDAAENAWLAWQELCDSRQPGMNGPSGLTYAEIDAYIRLTGNNLNAWEVDTIRRVDRLYRKIMTE